MAKEKRRVSDLKKGDIVIIRSAAWQFGTSRIERAIPLSRGIVFARWSAGRLVRTYVHKMDWNSEVEIIK